MSDNIPDVLYEDSDILILSKPAGMIVNNADTSKNVCTLQDYIKDNFKIDIKKNDSEDFRKREGIVHRLDKDTSGVIIIAKNNSSFENLQKQFKDRSVKKTYVALLHGKIVEEGEINAPIGRLPWNRMRFGIVPSGRESFTKFKLIELRKFKDKNREEFLSLVKVFPQTGRTHQIRVHFQYAGFPLFADSLYAGRKAIARDKKYLSRHFLHAYSIEFDHPVTKRKVKFTAELTNDLFEFLNKLEKII